VHGVKAQRKLGVAVVGLGVGEQHALAYSRLRECALRALYDLNPQRVDEVIARIGHGAPAKNFAAILADAEIEALSIATYDDAHCEQVEAALRAGKHVFVEKPLCRSLEELRSIKKIWLSRESLKLAANLVLRATPLYQWLRKTIEEGVLGEIYAFDGDYLYGRIEKITEGWRNRVDNYSVMQGGGIHLLDLMLWLTRQKPAHVTAAGNRICTAGSKFRYHDFVASTFQFPSGLIGRITANFGCVHRHQHIIRVFGTRGTFIYDDMGPRLHASRDPALAAAPVNLSPLPESKGDLIPAFVHSIIEKDDTRPQTQHEFDVISSCVAADLALATMKSQPIEYV
jgi:predicted dehydrogenase